MITKFFAESEIKVDQITVKTGDVLCTLDSPDGIPPAAIVRALHSGKASENPPKTKGLPGAADQTADNKGE